MNKILALVVILVAGAAFSTIVPMPDKEKWEKMTPSERRQNLEYRLGGRVFRPGTGLGRVVFVNSQKSASASVIQSCVNDLKNKFKFNIELSEGNFEFPKPKIFGEMSLYVVDDDSLPPLLSAPESRWVLVNVAGLKVGDGQKQSFFEARVRKELTRGFCLLAGAQDSTYRNSLTGAILKPSDLDNHLDCSVPIDVVQRITPYMAKFGVTPIDMVPYALACKEGWAPKPTNSVQQAYWDDAHNIPKKPIKIKFDRKRGK